MATERTTKMKTLAALERVLEASVQRHGEKPLTNAHLLNIVKMARRLEQQREEREAHAQQALEAELAEIIEDRHW